MKSERLYKKEGDQWSPLRRADVVTYGVIGAKGVPYEVNGKVGVLLNVECEEEKGRRGRRPVRKYYTKKEATNGRPTLPKKLFFAFFDSVFM